MGCKVRSFVIYLIEVFCFSGIFAILTYLTGGSWGFNGWAGITIFLTVIFGLSWWTNFIHDNYKKNPESKFWCWWEDVRCRVAGEHRPK
jgi:hypothetical protein